MSHTPFTPEQVEWLEQSRRRSVRMALRKFRNAALAGYLILMLGVIFNTVEQRHETNVRRHTALEQRHAIVRSGTAVSVEGCNRDFKTITGLRGILITSDEFSKTQLKKGLIDKERYQRSHDFYVDALTKVPLPDCRAALKIITDDPSKPVRVPVPLHP